MDKKISKEARSFNPLYSKIITICAKKLNGETQVFSGADEKLILCDFFEHLKTLGNVQFVSFNGYKFDVPFLVIRSKINKLNMPIKINTNQWSMETSNHFDVMLFFSNKGNFVNPNLDVLGYLYGVGVEGDRFGGVEVERLYKEGKLDKIVDHCKQDILLLEGIYKKFFM